MSRRRSAAAARFGAAAPVFAALGETTRLTLVAKLCAAGPLSIVRLSEGTGVTRQAITKHLILLERANLLVTIWRGREKLHYLNPVPIAEIYERWIGKYERHQLRMLHDLKRALEGEHDG